VVTYTQEEELAMAEIPILSAVINGLVSVFTAYTQYKAATKQAEVKQEAPPAQSAEVAKGEVVAQVVETAITKHGTEDERADLANFQRNPQRYADTIAAVIRELATREPSFAQQLQLLAQQANIARAGSNVVNINNDASNYGAQGIFNAPVSFETRHTVGDTVMGDKVAGDKVMGDKRTINTGGGDYAEGTIDKRQGVFVSGGTVQGPVIGHNAGTVNATYGTSHPETPAAPQQEIGANAKRQRLSALEHRLELLEIQKARQGYGTDPAIVTEIEDLQQQIADVRKQLD